MPGEDLGGHVVVAVDPVLAGVEAAFVSPRVARSMEHEPVVMRRVVPGSALGIGAASSSRRSSHSAVPGMGWPTRRWLVSAPSEPADKLVVAALGNLRGIVAEGLANPGEQLTPGRSRGNPVAERAVGPPVVVRADARPDVDEIGRRSKVRLDQTEVSPSDRSRPGRRDSGTTGRCDLHAATP